MLPKDLPARAADVYPVLSRLEDEGEALVRQQIEPPLGVLCVLLEEEEVVELAQSLVDAATEPA